MVFLLMYTVKKICWEIKVPVLRVFMHKQYLKIQSHLCWKLEVRVPKNHSDNRKIIAAAWLKFIVLHVINFSGSCTEN